MGRPKISLVGAGNIGGVQAQLIAESRLGDVVLFDVIEGVPQGKALDIDHALEAWGSASSVVGTNDYADTAGSDLCIVTAGLARKPGMSRDDLLNTNLAIIKEVAEGIRTPFARCDRHRGLQPPRRHGLGDEGAHGLSQAARLRHGRST